jgi:hypothetical protein
MLWEIYGAAMVESMLCIIVGSYMLFSSGVGADITFSQVLLASRNPTLDVLCAEDNSYRRRHHRRTASYKSQIWIIARGYRHQCQGKPISCCEGTLAFQTMFKPCIHSPLSLYSIFKSFVLLYSMLYPGVCIIINSNSST